MRRLLFKPFAWGTFLRISVAAVLAESVVVNFRYLTPQLDLGELPALTPAVRNTSAFIPLLIIAGLVAVDALLLGWYVLIRLRFVIFHALIYESAGLREGWRKYNKAADRFFRVCLMTSLGIVFLVALVVVALAVVAFGVLNLKTPDGKYDAGVFLTLFFPALGFAAAVLVASVLARIVLHDFVLPHMALEGATFKDAWCAVRRQIRADREGFFSYFLLRVLIAIVAGPVLIVVAFLVLWPLF